MGRIALALRGKRTDAYEATDAEEHQTDTFLGQGVALVCALDFRPLGVSTVSVRHLVGGLAKPEAETHFCKEPFGRKQVIAHGPRCC